MTVVSIALREQVRERANERCEYCYHPEGYSARAHQVDHIIPQKHDGKSTLDNLAWSCFQCNNQSAKLMMGEFDSTVYIDWRLT